MWVPDCVQNFSPQLAVVSEKRVAKHGFASQGET